ncbi:cobalt ABC transporter permease [Thalassospira sp.]|uniref:cobalt ABC transporter permease n=1 Tax=Thalassospira sp. TaxID=1912094 RepID=UPI0026063EEF|nr:cobalt ABC transporter permease [Thalassospira sp.]
MVRLLALLLTMVALLQGTGSAEAHKVIASVFPSGPSIEGEVGFSNGVMAGNTLVEVLAPDGTKIDEITTDEDGFFVYTPSGDVDLRFRADLGAGHVAEAAFAINDLSNVAQANATSASSAKVAVVATTENAVPAITRAQEEIIASIVRDELRPLRREITAYKEKNDLQSILGGIGYIFGAFGIVYYLAARRLRAKAPEA